MFSESVGTDMDRFIAVKIFKSLNEEKMLREEGIASAEEHLIYLEGRIT
jgi:hypothetical protein